MAKVLGNVAEAMTDVKVARDYADQCYKGDHYGGPARVMLSGRKCGLTPTMKRELRQRSAIEPMIGHAKNDGRLGRNYLLGHDGDRISAITIQKILNKAELGPKYDRWLALEEKTAVKKIEPSGEQVASLEKLNPCFHERHVESGSPGESLSANTFFVGNLKGIGKVAPCFAAPSASAAPCSMNSSA